MKHIDYEYIIGHVSYYRIYAKTGAGTDLLDEGDISFTLHQSDHHDTYIKIIVDNMNRLAETFT